MADFALGLVVGHRHYFPQRIAEQARTGMLAMFASMGIDGVVLAESDSAAGAVETLADARRCADLFIAQRPRIAGVVVTLPDFAEERAIANTLRWAGLDVPVLVHACPDDFAPGQPRRDAWWGKISACNALRQYRVPFTLTFDHVSAPQSESFRRDLADFAGVCRVVRGLRNLRVGLIGARPAVFNTMRFSEKLLEASGISVETIDLSEIIEAVRRLDAGDAAVRAKIDEVAAYVDTRVVTREQMESLGRLGAVIDRWMEDNRLGASAIQCWSALPRQLGVYPCALMAMMGSRLQPSACETDVTGAVSMAALALASGKPSAVVDWNNNYGGDPERCVLFHCSNFPRELMEHAAMGAKVTHRDENGVAHKGTGNLEGRLRPGDFTFCRIATDDLEGRITAYVGSGEITSDPLETFGGYGVARVSRLRELMWHICRAGFEHHVAINPSRSARVVHEALARYLGWVVHRHVGEGQAGDCWGSS